MNPRIELPLCPAPNRTDSAALGAFDVRRVEDRDFPFLVDVHLRQFPHGFYAQLGPAFKTRYLRQYFRSPGAIGLVAEQRDGSGLVGYLIGTVDDFAHDRFMHRSAVPALTAAGGSALAARPALWSDFMRRRALWYARRFMSGIVRTRRPSGEPRQGELLYICTTHGNRRRGIGAALLRSYVEEAQRAHAAGLHLVSERDNTPAHEFYAHRGWQVVSESGAAPSSGEIEVNTAWAATGDAPIADQASTAAIHPARADLLCLLTCEPPELATRTTDSVLSATLRNRRRIMKI